MTQDFSLSSCSNPSTQTAVDLVKPAPRSQHTLLNFGCYEAVKEIGKGASSTVYLAYDTEQKRHVALKVMGLGCEGNKGNQRLRHLFKKEASLVKHLNHPNIVQIINAGSEGDIAWLAMEYVEGKPLSQFIKLDQLLPPEKTIDLICKLALALDYAGRHGIIHRDIKPENILLTANNEIKITDFGLALDINTKDSQETTLLTGVGSPAYMSPEQVKDQSLNHQTDLYSLGVVLFELLTGRKPFRAKNYASLVYKIIHTDAPKVSAINPSLPNELDLIVQTAIAKDLSTRYMYGAQLAQDLAKLSIPIQTQQQSFQLQEKLKKLGQCQLLHGCDSDILWEILRIGLWRQFPAGSVIFSEKLPSDTEKGMPVYLILEGGVEIFKDDNFLEKKEGAAIIGELEFLLNQSPYRSTSAYAFSAVELIELSASAFAVCSEECKVKIHALVFDNLKRRLDRAEAVLAKQNVLK